VTSPGNDLVSDTDGDSSERIAPFLRRAPRIREEDVRQTADALLLEGGRPTVERVRARLGRGSPNTIALYLDRWWTHLGARLRDLPGQELPGVPEPVSKSLMSLWSEAIDQARALLHESLAQQSAELEQQRLSLAAAARELDRERLEFGRERAAVEQTVALAQKQLTEANERHRGDVARVQALQNEYSRMLEQCELARKDALASAHRLEAAHQTHQGEIRALTERMEATERHWLKQVDEARQALAAERKRIENLQHQRESATAQLSDELHTLRDERAHLQAQLVQTTEALSTARTEGEQQKQIAQSQAVRADAALKTLQDAQATAAQQFEVLHGQLRDLLVQTNKLQLAGRAGSRQPRPKAVRKE
jgi:Plasmid replication region DNA-binding N-term